MKIKRRAAFLSVIISVFLILSAVMTAEASDDTAAGTSPKDVSVKVVTPDKSETDTEKQAIKHSPALSYGMEIIKRGRKLKKTTSKGELTFSVNDFAEYSDNGTVNSVTLLSLPDPSEGSLKLGALDAFKGQTLYASVIGRLRFIPAHTGAKAEFTFSVNGSEDAVSCVLYSVDPGNSAPTVTNKTLYTKTGMSVSSCIEGSDPDKDDMTFRLVSGAKHGTVSLSGEGSVIYKPDDGFVGQDGFVCTASDVYGNESEPATVKIKVEQNKSGIVYADMDDDPAGYAAYLLAEKDIYRGRTVGGVSYFDPDNSVSRADFIVMAMKAAGYSPNVYSSQGYSDGYGGLTATQKGYAVTAASAGVINGSLDDPNGAITRYEAQSVIAHLNNGNETGDKGTDKPLTASETALMIAELILK